MSQKRVEPMSQPKYERNKSKIERIVIVSNRLPIVLTKGESGEWQVEPSSGGLVTAIAPILRDRGGLWIGWPGTLEEIDLAPGQFAHIQTGDVHRFEALDERVELVEVSTTELDDVVRLEDDYNREGTSEA